MECRRKDHGWVGRFPGARDPPSLHPKRPGSAPVSGCWSRTQTGVGAWGHSGREIAYPNKASRYTHSCQRASFSHLLSTGPKPGPRSLARCHWREAASLRERLDNSYTILLVLARKRQSAHPCPAAQVVGIAVSRILRVVIGVDEAGECQLFD